MNQTSNPTCDLTLSWACVGSPTDGGWIPGVGLPEEHLGHVGHRYIDVETGHIYGPKTRDGWPQIHTHTLNLGSVSGEYAALIAQVPVLDGRVSNLEARTTILESRADSTDALTNQHQVTLRDHGIRIEILEAVSLEMHRRLGSFNSALSARIQALEAAISALHSGTYINISTINSRLDILTSELNGNSSTLTHLQETYASLNETWAQDVINLRSEFDDNIGELRRTLRTYANHTTALAEYILELNARVNDNAAAIILESEARADEFGALARQITQLTAETTTSSANLTSQFTTVANKQEAYASSVLAMSAKMGDSEAAFRDTVITLVSADEALSRRVTTLDVATSNLQGRITSEESARISGDSVVLSSTKQMIASSESGFTVKISEEKRARIEADQAETFTRNEQISSLSGTIDDVSAAVTDESETRAEVDGYLGARTTLTTRVSGAGGVAVAGMEISATSPANRQAFSQFAVFADRFIITHSQQNVATAPFRVEGSKVYIESAVIKNASIDTLHIAGNAVSVSGGATGLYSAYVTMYTNVWTVFILVGTFIQGDGKDVHIWELTSNGASQTGAKPIAGTTGALSAIVHVGPGSHTFGISCRTQTGDSGCGLSVIGIKR